VLGGPDRERDAGPGEDRGEKKYDEILGTHMIGPRATSWWPEATLALRMEITSRSSSGRFAPPDDVER